MTKILTCTTNTLCNVDYKTPISVYKSTDYRTSTGTYHRFMPPLPRDFDARVKPNINPKLFQSEPKLKEEHYKSTYTAEYHTKQAAESCNPRSVPLDNVHYLRNVQEKMFEQPPPPIPPGISVTKSEYYEKSLGRDDREVHPPNNFAYCEIKALGRDEQPPVHPELNGYYRLMDPYMTTSRITYIPFTLGQQEGIARKDIVTFYDASGFPRGGRGYGPKNCTEVEPLFRSEKGIIYDRSVFKTKVYNKILPKFMKRIPNYGMQSEYQGKYTLQTYLDSYPTIHSTLEDYEDSLPKAGPWQNLAPPAMYCTDYCHIGTGWPVRSVVEPKKPEDCIERDVDLCRPEEVTENDVCSCEEN